MENATVVELSMRCLVRGFVDTTPLSDVSPAVTGVNLSGDRSPVLKFLGIPYAAPQRWTRAREDVRWDGVRECFEFGPIPFQPTGVIPLEQVWFDVPGFHPRLHIKQDEQCLSANIFRPLKVETPLPVFIFIYGGALRIGCSTKTRHDPTEFIRLSEQEGKPILVVTFNYRVGLLGFMNHPDLKDDEGFCGNWGLHDILFFFQWVQRNVARFGGDPQNVTVMGNSAGAWAIGALMTRRRMNGEKLFKNIIFSSGGPGTMSFRPRGDYYPYYGELLTKAGADREASLEDRLAAIRAVPAVELLQFSSDFFPFGNFGATAEEGPNAIFDKPSFEYLNKGDYDPSIASCMVGCVTNESTLSGHALKMATTAGHRDYILRFPKPVQPELLSLYPVLDEDSEDIKTAPGYQLLADHVFTGLSYHLAHVLSTIPNKYTNKTLPTYNFRFDGVLIPSKAPTLGVFHTSDLAFVFQTRSMWEEGSDQDLSACEWGKRWLQFFSTGIPGVDWPTFDASRERRAVFGTTPGILEVESVNEVFNSKQLKWWHETWSTGGHEAVRIAALPGDVLKAGLGETIDTMP